MVANKGKVLIVGARKSERELLKSWLTARGHVVWFSDGAVEALRVYEEVNPEIVLIDTLLRGMDAVRFALVLNASDPHVELAFLGNHNLESAYFSSIPELPKARLAHRPIDPELIFGVAEPDDDNALDIASRGVSSTGTLTRLFLEIYENRASGILYIGSPDDRRVLYFYEGNPVYAESNVLDENFGRFLLNRGTISDIEFNWARNMQLGEGIRQGEALVKINVLTQEELREQLALQIRQKAINAFSLEGVPYHFDHDERFINYKDRFPLNAFDVLLSALEVFRFKDAPSWNASKDSPMQLDSKADDRVLRDLTALFSASMVRALKNGTTLATLEGHGIGRSRLLALREALIKGGYLAE